MLRLPTLSGLRVSAISFCEAVVFVRRIDIIDYEIFVKLYMNNLYDYEVISKGE